jgi:flagellar hook capping protein FlgD
MAKAALAPATKYQWQLLQNSPVANSRTDDIWFFDELTGWLVNSSGYVCKTEDGGDNWTPKFFVAPNLPSFPYLRCMSWANRKIGWFGTVTGVEPNMITSPSQFIQTLLYKTTDGGETWKAVENLPEGSPAGICGFHAVNERVAYGSGTNDPGLPGPAIIKTTDAGASWELIDMRKYASNLIDIYFFDEDNGFVVGGLNDQSCKIDVKAYPPPRLSRYGKVKPVILRTRDGGKSWTNTTANIKDFECGEWGWKIQFLNETHGFVSLENFRNASILVTRNGGKSWVKKHVAKDQKPASPAINNDLEGIGFINERQGWVGGWGFQDLNTPVGGLENSYTEDGGDTWIAQNHLPDPDTKIQNDPRYRINRYRFVKNVAGDVISGYCSGQQVFKLKISGVKKAAYAKRTHGLLAAMERVEPANSTQGSMTSASGPQSDKAPTKQKAMAIDLDHDFELVQLKNDDGTVQISYNLPEDAENVFLGLWNKFAFHIRTLVSEKTQTRGRRTIVWDGKDDQGNPAGAGVFICRMCTDGGKGASQLIELQGAF